MNSTKSFLRPKSNQPNLKLSIIPDLLKLHPKGEDESWRAYSKRLAEDHASDVLEMLGEPYTANSLRTIIHKKGFSNNDKRDLMQYKTEDIKTDKEDVPFSWRSLVDASETFKKEVKKYSKSQDEAIWSVKTKKPICVMILSDTHIGSWGTNHEIIKNVIDEIISIPDLYVILAGDLTQMAIKMRSMAEVSDNLLPPKWQHKVLESIIKEIKHKVIAATWENHAAEREEKLIGYSPTSVMLEDNVIYFAGIGHLNLLVGKQEYKVGVSHLFRGRSMYNGTHGQQRYIRHEAPFLDACVAGDSHVPWITKYTEGAAEKVVMNTGAAQTNSSYAKRYFSLKTFPIFPCFTLDPAEHCITPFWSVKEWLRAKR